MVKTKLKKTTRSYTLKISEAQAKLISVAAELYARLGAGQFTTLDRFFWDDLIEARPHLESLHKMRNGSLSTFGNIESKTIDDDYRILFDLHRVIRHRLAWDQNPQPEGMRTVDYNTPRRTSKKEPLAKITQSAQKIGRLKGTGRI